MGGHDRNVQYLCGRFPHARVLRWTDHLSTIKRAVSQSRTRYCWILSSCIEYQDFDFHWEPSPWQSHQVHCWPSGSTHFGDTFLVPSDQWAQQSDSLSKLEDFKDINFEHQPLTRLPWQVVHYRDTTIPEILKTSKCDTPYVLFTNQSDCVSDYQPWLWREQPVVSFSRDNGVTLIPRSAHGIIDEQVYDYPWSHKNIKGLPGEPLDVVFISNGEHGADHHWRILSQIIAERPNRIHRVDGVNGRVACYQAAARASHTDWFFAVFAKIQANEDFDWSWQPDRWQQPKHYIFHAYNPVNHLTYGHQAMIAYNRRLVLENTGQGLDFTLDQAHEVVPIVSGTAYYDNDPWTCWRTAFREALKLRHSLPDVENEYRLGEWLDKGDGVNGHWSQRGAQDAVEYYESVNGEFDELKKSYEWNWLASYALMRHPQLFTQSKT